MDNNMGRSAKTIPRNSSHSFTEKNIHEDTDFSLSRKTTNRAGFKKTIGKFPSLKMRRTVKWESQIERDFLYLLEFDPDVLIYHEQPVEILYAYRTKTGKYYPDFYVERFSGKELIEVKPFSKLGDPDNEIKFLAGEEYCRGRGWIFRVVTDEQIRKDSFLENIKLLNRYAAVDVPTEFRHYALTLVETNGGEMCLAELIAGSKDKFGRAAINNIYSLLYRQSLYAHLKKPLTDETTIKLLKGVG